MELRVLSPTAILGYGFPLESLERGLREEPNVIAVDAGSTDPGPYYLGEGVPFVPDANVERDLYYLVKASLAHEIPLVIGSAGGSGARPHVERTLRLLERIASRLGAKLRIAVVWSDVNRDWLIEKLRKGLVEPAEGWPRGQLSKKDIDESIRIVAQQGVEPIMEALKSGASIVLAGRVVDVAPFAALAWLKGFDRGLALHMAKILECGAIAAEPGSGSDGMMGVLRRSEFEVYPLSPSRKATKLSVSEHALYERTNPFKECIPGGCVDLSGAVYDEVDGRVVVKGSRWLPSTRYMVKLEGVTLAGHRVIVVMGIRDPDVIKRIDWLLQEALKEARRLHGGSFEAYIHVYGRDAILGEWEPTPRPGHEIGVVVEVVDRDLEKAKAVAAVIRSRVLHAGWPGRRTTAGNIAFPFSPSDVYAGRAYKWSIWHLVELSDPLEVARIEERVVG